MREIYSSMEPIAAWSKVDKVAGAAAYIVDSANPF
jgi:hypothetical protein